MFGKYGHIDVASLTYCEIARLRGYDLCRDDPQVRERERTGPRQKGSIEERCFLRDTSLPSPRALPMPKASGIPPDEVIVHRDEMDRGEDPAAQSARASEDPACLATHFILHTHVDRTDGDYVDISYTYAAIRTSDWVILSQDSNV